MRISRSLAGCFLLIFFISFQTACTKPEGYGGTGSISGKVVNHFYNDDYSLTINQEAAVDEEIFILFGDDATVGEREITGPDGDFTFNYLQPGSYQIYYLSEDKTGNSRDQYPAKFDIVLEAGQDVDLGELERIVSLDFDDGTASIGGHIRLTNYKSFPEFPFLEVKDISNAQDYEVYIIYGGHEYYDQRIRSSYNGYFEFQNLIPGEYEVFTYTEDVEGGTEDIVISRQVTIQTAGQEIVLDTINVEKL